jgi:hypothetical protein
MENSLEIHLDIPENYSDSLRARAEVSGRECLKQGYQAAGWGTLEAIGASIMTSGVTVGGAVAYVTGRVQQAIQTCLKNESANLGKSLQDDLRLGGSTDTHWSDWQ